MGIKTNLDYHQTMWAEMSPDIYDGDNCDQIKPRWHCFAEGDMDSDYVKSISLNASNFPPGTKVIVLEPRCPKCKQIPDLCRDDKNCDFDWRAWTEDKYS